MEKEYKWYFVMKGCVFGCYCFLDGITIQPKIHTKIKYIMLTNYA